MGNCSFINNISNIPTLIKFNNLNDDKIVDFAIGKEHVVFLSKLNSIFGIGSNEHGQLAVIAKKSNDVAVNLLQNTNLEKLKVNKIFATFHLTFFTTFDNELYACGMNEYSQSFQPFVIESSVNGKLHVEHYFTLNNFMNVTKLVNKNIEDIKDIKCNGRTSFIVFNDSSIVESLDYTLIDRGLGDYYDPKKVIKLHNNYNEFKFEKNYDQLILNEYQILSLHNNECKYIDYHSKQSNMDNIINMESGTFHSVLQTADQKFYSFGSNEFGELGYANKSSNESKLIALPFTIKEGDEIRVCCGKNFTIFIHETDNENSLKINNVIVTDNFKFNYEINSNFYLDLNLLKNLSNDFYNLIKNNNVIEHLNENDQRVLYYVIKNAIIDLNCLNIDELFSNYDKFIKLISFGELELNLVTCLFILNDINDIKNEIKSLLFNDISNRMNVDNIMRILQKVNHYLSLNILKQAKNSILLLLANKCLAFIKENANLLKSDPLFQIIQDKINNVKQPFKQINYKIDNLENITKNVTESLKLLYNDETNSDIHVIINKDKNELLQLHKSILSVHNSVLNILFKNNENNVIDMYEFIEMMVSDHWVIDLFNNSSKINEILQIIFKLCYGYEINELKLNDLVGILIISQQLDITWIVKHASILIVEKLYSINDTEFIILLNLASVSQNNNDCKELVEYFKIFCSHTLTLDYLQKIQLSCQDNIPCNNFLKVIIDYWLRVNRK